MNKIYSHITSQKLTWLQWRKLDHSADTVRPKQTRGLKVKKHYKNNRIRNYIIKIQHAYCESIHNTHDYSELQIDMRRHINKMESHKKLA